MEQHIDLITRKEFREISQRIGLKRFNFDQYIYEKLQIQDINDLYASVNDQDPLKFIDNVLSELDIQVEINPKDLERIPKEGGFIAISNHPYGILDGLILIKMFYTMRKDFKIMANHFLERIEPIKDQMIMVNPFDRSKKLNFSGIKQTLAHIDEGNCIGIFPAGEVSTLRTDNWRIEDKKWDKSIIRMIQRSDKPVVPVHFEGSNSLNFHLSGFLHPYLRTAKIPKELLNKKSHTIKLRIGKPISRTEISKFPSTDDLGDYLRTNTYMLSSKFKYKKKLRKNTFDFPTEAKEIIPPVSGKKILQEISKLEATSLLFKESSYSVYLANPDQIPYCLREIARLREVAFRKVGEGTNRSLDIDQFDFRYSHLILWNHELKDIVGSYRLGFGANLIESFGRRGFYTNSLFKFKKEFIPILEQTIELGRSFIVPKYQKLALPLSLLWRGIYIAALKNPDYRYLMGPVSLSKDFSDLSQYMVVDFMKKNHFNTKVAALVKARKQFQAHFKKLENDQLVDSIKNLNDLNKVIERIDDLTVPTLWKQYVKQNAEFIGFNIDPKFNNCLDGLILLDLHEVPMKIIRQMSKGISASGEQDFLKNRNLTWEED